MLAPDTVDALALSALVEGDERAFGRLARLLAGPGLALALRILGERALAEDAVQEALQNLWRARARFDPERGAVGPWWRRIVARAALSGRRRLRPAVPLAHAGDPADDRPGPEAETAHALEMARVEAAMAGLPPRQRAALALFHGAEATMEEIADVLGTTSKAVEGLLARGRVLVRARLGGETS